MTLHATTAEPLSCAITFDFDGMSSWIAAKSTNPSTLSRGQFGAVAIPRILALLDHYGITSSFAVPGHTAYAWPTLVKDIHERGHELVHHKSRFEQACGGILLASVQWKLQNRTCARTSSVCCDPNRCLLGPNGSQCLSANSPHNN